MLTVGHQNYWLSSWLLFIFIYLFKRYWQLQMELGQVSLIKMSVEFL